MNIKLYYFNIPFWRAEVSRLALFIGAIPFEDIRLKEKSYDEFKSTGKLPNGKLPPFRQLPVLEVNGKIIAQTGAIARYCGKLTGLYPSNNDIDAARIDQIIEAAQDINYIVSISSREKNPEKKKIIREILSTKHLPKWFQFLENLIKENNESKWFVGENLTIADLAIWRLLGWLSSGMLDGVPKNILEPYANLKEMRKEIYEHPKVKEWMLTKYGEDI